MTWAQLTVGRGWVARNPLAAAFGISLMIHVALFGGWRIGKQLGWWDHQATWLLNLSKKLHPRASFAKIQKLLPPAPREIPLTFVEVDPAVAAAEAPKEAKYYGAHSSTAANPDALLESKAPKVDGQQTKIVKLENVPKPGPQPLQPALPPEKTTPAPEPESKPKPSQPPGDLALANPDQLRKASEGAEAIQRERPRTLAAAREQKHMIAGEKMKQDDGTRQRGRVSLDVKATPFGAYDAAFIAAVQQRWYDLLDSAQFAQRSGKVVLEFRLHYDGRITEMKMNGNEVGELLELLCEKAIKDPAPFPHWPDDMRRLVGNSYREVIFTFFYN